MLRTGTRELALATNKQVRQLAKAATAKMARHLSVLRRDTARPSNGVVSVTSTWTSARSSSWLLRKCKTTQRTAVAKRLDKAATMVHGRGSNCAPDLVFVFEFGFWTPAWTAACAPVQPSRHESSSERHMSRSPEIMQRPKLRLHVATQSAKQVTRSRYKYSRTIMFPRSAPLCSPGPSERSKLQATTGSARLVRVAPSVRLHACRPSRSSRIARP